MIVHPLHSNRSAAIRAMAAAALLLVPALAMLGCCTCRDAGVREQFSVELSAGGGFSGVWTGHIVHADGTVQKWEGRAGKTEQVKTVGSVDPADVRDLRTMIEKDGLMKLPLRETGNMTTLLRLTVGEQTQFITWPGAMSETDAVPSDLSAVYVKLRSLLDRAD